METCKRAETQIFRQTYKALPMANTTAAAKAERSLFAFWVIHFSEGISCWKSLKRASP